MRINPLFIVVFLLISSLSFAESLNEIKGSHLGSRLGLARVCLNLAAYKQSYQAGIILRAYDERVTDYLSKLKDTKRLTEILDALSKTQLRSMENTGLFMWNIMCRSALDHGDFL